MKYIKVGTVLAGIVVILVIVGIRLNQSKTQPQTQLLPPNPATLAGPQAPLPTTAYNPKTPLSKNRIILKNSMKIEITKEGNGIPIVQGQTAVVEYVGALQNGTVFDASKNHGDGSFSFTVGAGQVIKGWDEGVFGMKIGESRTLTIPPELAYGPNGIPPTIPPSATLVFEITLRAIK